MIQMSRLRISTEIGTSSRRERDEIGTRLGRFIQALFKKEEDRWEGEYSLNCLLLMT